MAGVTLFRSVAELVIAVALVLALIFGWGW